eukprot:1780795-Prymnesium_polylepis.1
MTVDELGPCLKEVRNDRVAEALFVRAFALVEHRVEESVRARAAQVLIEHDALMQAVVPVLRRAPNSVTPFGRADDVLHADKGPRRSIADK